MKQEDIDNAVKFFLENSKPIGKPIIFHIDEDEAETLLKEVNNGRHKQETN